ncbi:hypothetical protein P691DRAFT_649194, partial [Macrolepiota fuliginosa MF-IS2]
SHTSEGPMLIGLLINMFLFGTMMVQVYIYYTTYKEDCIWLKLLIFAVFIVDAVNAAENILYIYAGVITHFGDSEYLTKVSGGMSMIFCLDSASSPLLQVIIGIIVQLFFAWRIFALTRSWVMVTVVAALASVVSPPHMRFFLTQILQYSGHSRDVFVILWLAGTSAADIVITASLVWYLQRHKTGFRASDMMVNHVIRVTIQTGLVTSVVAIMDLVFFLVKPDSGMHMLFNIPLSKVYSNSLASSLNSR